MVMKRLYTLMLCLSMALSQGCGSSSVADGVGQREANQIVAVLGEHGISATTEKTRGGKGRYSVIVPSSHFGAAAALLSAMDLPADRGASFEELLAPSGLLPASKEVEDLRLDRAMASEIEDLLLTHGGIASVGVVVRSNSKLGGEPPSVSIMAQTTQGSTVSPEQVRELVGRAVPGLKASDISLVVTERIERVGGTTGENPQGLVPFLRYWKVPKDQYNGLALLLIGLFSFVACLASLGGYIYGQFSANRGGDLPTATGLNLPRGERSNGSGDIEREGER